MSRVGIKELKNKLSAYLKRVESGERVEVTNRGEVIALLISAKRRKVNKEVLALVEEGTASWAGGKPLGSPRPVKGRGRPLSDVISEDRR